MMTPGVIEKGLVLGRRVVLLLSDERFDGESVLAVASAVN
jgi:hypothetical protein